MSKQHSLSKMEIHSRCRKASSSPTLNRPLGPMAKKVLLFVNTHDNYKLADIREAVWPGLLDRCYKSVSWFESNVKHLNPCRIDALAKHMASGYNSCLFAKLVKRGWLAYDTSYRWHITELGAARLVMDDLD